MSAVEARRLLREAQLESSEIPTYPSDSDTIAAAQVEATLAVVEQQRIANLLTMRAYAIAMPDGRDIDDALTVDTLDGARLNPEIAEALGVGHGELVG